MRWHEPWIHRHDLHRSPSLILFMTASRSNPKIWTNNGRKGIGRFCNSHTLQTQTHTQHTHTHNTQTHNQLTCSCSRSMWATERRREAQKVERREQERVARLVCRRENWECRPKVGVPMWFTHRGAHQCGSLNRILTSHYNATLAPTTTRTACRVT